MSAFDYGIWIRYAISLQMIEHGPRFKTYVEAGIDFPSLIYFVLDNSPNLVEPFTLMAPLPLLDDGDLDTVLLNHTAEMIEAAGYFVLSSSTVGVIENPNDETEQLLKDGVDPKDIPGLVNKPAIVAFYNGLGGMLIAHSTFTGDSLDEVEWLVPEDTYVLGLEAEPLNAPLLLN